MSFTRRLRRRLLRDACKGALTHEQERAFQRQLDLLSLPADEHDLAPIIRELQFLDAELGATNQEPQRV